MNKPFGLTSGLQSGLVLPETAQKLPRETKTNGHIHNQEDSSGIFSQGPTHPSDSLFGGKYLRGSQFAVMSDY